MSISYFTLLLLHRIVLMKSGSSLPRVELEEMGPSLDFVMRRTHLASAEFYKKACRKPKALKVSVWECNMSNVLSNSHHCAAHFLSSTQFHFRSRRWRTSLLIRLVPSSVECTWRDKTLRSSRLVKWRDWSDQGDKTRKAFQEQSRPNLILDRTSMTECNVYFCSHSTWSIPASWHESKKMSANTTCININWNSSYLLASNCLVC